MFRILFLTSAVAVVLPFAVCVQKNDVMVSYRCDTSEFKEQQPLNKYVVFNLQNQTTQSIVSEMQKKVQSSVNQHSSEKKQDTDRGASDAAPNDREQPEKKGGAGEVPVLAKPFQIADVIPPLTIPKNEVFTVPVSRQPAKKDAAESTTQQKKSALCPNFVPEMMISSQTSNTNSELSRPSAPRTRFRSTNRADSPRVMSDRPQLYSQQASNVTNPPQFGPNFTPQNQGGVSNQEAIKYPTAVHKMDANSAPHNPSGQNPASERSRLGGDAGVNPENSSQIDPDFTPPYRTGTSRKHPLFVYGMGEPGVAYDFPQRNLPCDSPSMTVKINNRAPQQGPQNSAAMPSNSRANHPPLRREARHMHDRVPPQFASPPSFSDGTPSSERESSHKNPNKRKRRQTSENSVNYVTQKPSRAELERQRIESEKIAEDARIRAEIARRREEDARMQAEMTRCQEEDARMRAEMFKRREKREKTSAAASSQPTVNFPAPAVSAPPDATTISKAEIREQKTGASPQSVSNSPAPAVSAPLSSTINSKYERLVVKRKIEFTRPLTYGEMHLVANSLEAYKRAKMGNCDNINLAFNQLFFYELDKYFETIPKSKLDDPGWSKKRDAIREQKELLEVHLQNNVRYLPGVIEFLMRRMQCVKKYMEYTVAIHALILAARGSIINGQWNDVYSCQNQRGTIFAVAFLLANKYLCDIPCNNRFVSETFDLQTLGSDGKMHYDIISTSELTFLTWLNFDCGVSEKEIRDAEGYIFNILLTYDPTLLKLCRPPEAHCAVNPAQSATTSSSINSSVSSSSSTSASSSSSSSSSSSASD